VNDKKTRPAARRGRPREFDTEKALEAALELFWRQGYEGTSLAELTKAMGINGPSLYAAFGNKEELFHKALTRYAEKHCAYFRAALAQSTARQVAERLLTGAIKLVTRPRGPKGCLSVQGALASSDAAEPVRKAVRRFHATAEAAIRERFERAATERDVPRGVDPVSLARYLWAVHTGIAVQAAGGATAAQLGEIVEVVMRNWPT
jgi:AcrR family transcriptional regulator